MRYRRGTNGNFGLSTSARTFTFACSGNPADNLMGPSKDRVALILSNNSNGVTVKVTVAPGTDATSQSAGVLLQAGAQPLVLTREQIGDVICMEWSCFGPATAPISVTEILASGPADDCDCHAN